MPATKLLRITGTSRAPPMEYAKIVGYKGINEANRAEVILSEIVTA